MLIFFLFILQISARRCELNAEFAFVAAGDNKMYKANKSDNFNFKFEFDRGKNNMTTSDWVFLNVLDFQPDWELRESEESPDIMLEAGNGIVLAIQPVPEK